MTRHSKNCTAHSVYTYHEKKRDTKISGYGSQEMRLSKDSVKEFDCCCLTLQPCKDAMITPDGYLYDREAILEFIIKRKRDTARQMKEYEKQKRGDVEELKKIALEEQKSKVNSFLEANSVKSIGDRTQSNSSSVSNMSGQKSKELPSFWIPNLTPDAKPNKITKPDSSIRCPMTNKPLRFKDLVPITFDVIKDDEEALSGKSKSLIVKQTRYKCAVTGDALTNSTPCCVLKSSGRVVTQECFEKLIKKDMIDPTNSKKMKESDVIYMQRGSSGFAGSGLKLTAKIDGPVMTT